MDDLQAFFHAAYVASMVALSLDDPPKQAG